MPNHFGKLVTSGRKFFGEVEYVTAAHRRRQFRHPPPSDEHHRHDCHLINDSKEPAERWELHDVKADPGERHDLAARHPEIVNMMRAAYARWWAGVLPSLENEDAVLPAINPYHELYWKQYRGPGPNNVPPGAKVRGT